MEHRGAHQGRFHSPHRFSEARVRRKGSGAHGPTSPNPYDTENGPVAYARHITSPVTALAGAAERQQVETGGGSTYRQEQASANKDMRRCNQRQVTSAGGNKRERDRRSRSKRQQARTSGNGKQAGTAGTESRQKRASTGRRHFMPSIQQGGPAKRPAPLTPGSQVEKSSGFPYVGEETR